MGFFNKKEETEDEDNSEEEKSEPNKECSFQYNWEGDSECNFRFDCGLSDATCCDKSKCPFWNR